MRHPYIFISYAAFGRRLIVAGLALSSAGAGADKQLARAGVGSVDAKPSAAELLSNSLLFIFPFTAFLLLFFSGCSHWLLVFSTPPSRMHSSCARLMERDRTVAQIGRRVSEHHTRRIVQYRLFRHNLHTYLKLHRYDLSRFEHNLVVTGLHLDRHFRVVVHIEAHPLGAFERRMPGRRWYRRRFRIYCLTCRRRRGHHDGFHNKK
jgi:hypothetical protein